MTSHISILQRELEEVKRHIAALKKATKTKPNYGLGEGDPDITRWEMDRALLDRLKGRRNALEQALAEISDDAYGICEKCGNQIHPDRLAVLPDTRTCIECARMAENRT